MPWAGRCVQRIATKTEWGKGTIITPLQSLAFSMQAAPGIYAVLLGSGVSKAAGIKTGWEITLDLIRKLARSAGADCEPDPERWYNDKFNKEPDYSKIVATLAKTSTEQQQMLRGYVEPTVLDSEKGIRTPTAAHRAIAKLVAKGFIRVAITTNFDRLLEAALNEEGVEPTVISTVDQATGAPPLVHTQCCVFKVHGDYRDTRIRNTAAKLNEYPEAFDNLLARIFDEFGLIVCGWSAEWDVALRNAIDRTNTHPHRFSTYWAHVGEPGDAAERLIKRRGAHKISIQDADTFFQDVRQSVESITAFARPYPLSTEAAVASLKRYMSAPRQSIRLCDLVTKTAEEVFAETTGEAFAEQGSRKPTSESLTTRVRKYEAACEKLLAMATVGGRWANEEDYLVWERVLQWLGGPVWADSYQSPPLHKLQRYPATLLLYALGLGAIEGNRLHLLKRLLDVRLPVEHGDYAPAVRVLPPGGVFWLGGDGMRNLEGMASHYLPLNAWVCKTLKQHAVRIIPDDKRYSFVFDKLEILMALSWPHHGDGTYSALGTWTIPGLFCDRYDTRRKRIMREIELSLAALGDESPFVTCNIFGATPAKCNQALEKLNKSILFWQDDLRRTRLSRE